MTLRAAFWSPQASLDLCLDRLDAAHKNRRCDSQKEFGDPGETRWDREQGDYGGETGRSATGGVGNG